MAGHIVLIYLRWEAAEDKSEQGEEISKPTQYNSKGLFGDARQSLSTMAEFD